MLDMLKPDETACLIDADSPEKWGQNIRRLIQDPDSAREIGQHAREYACEHHSTNAQVEALISLLERVMKGGAYAFSPPETSVSP